MQSVLYFVGVIFIVGIGWWLLSGTTGTAPDMSSPNDTAEPSTSTAPQPNNGTVGQSPNGNEHVEPAQLEDLIVVTAPLPGAEVTAPVEVAGRARGSWFFEATFPVVVVNWDGLIIGEGFVEATEDWMTTEYVPFSGTITFASDPDAYRASGTIILQKANPSGLPQNDNALEVPVVFSAGE